MEQDQTRIVTHADMIDLYQDDRLHCLEPAEDADDDARHIVGPLGLKIGRTSPADIVIADSEVSRSHCMVALVNGELLVSDLNSTNGTFIDGNRITGVEPLPVGAVLQVGKRAFKHEWRTRGEIEQSAEVDRELRRAAAYVRALLPPQISEGPIRTKWYYKPSAKLGGDAFGYGRLSEDKYVCYLVDVAGHGAGAAMHAVAIMNQLRQQNLPDTDMSQPREVLGTLNQIFGMDEHAGLYFTIWYGVYDRSTRWLNFASGGQHPAFLISPDGRDFTPLQTRNLIIGAMPGVSYTQASVRVEFGRVGLPVQRRCLRDRRYGRHAVGDRGLRGSAERSRGRLSERPAGDLPDHSRARPAAHTGRRLFVSRCHFRLTRIGNQWNLSLPN